MKKKKLVQRIKDAWEVLLGKKHAKAYAKRTDKKNLSVEEFPGVEE